MIDVTYTLTWPEYLEAQRIYMRASVKRTRMRRVVLLSLLVAGLLVFFWLRLPPRSALLNTLAAAVISIALGLTLRRGAQTALYRKRFESDSPLLTDVHLSVDEAGVHTEATTVGHGTFLWTAFTNWYEGKLGFVLIAGHLFRAIPKRALSASQSNDLRKNLEQRVGSAGSSRRSPAGE